MYEVVRSCSLKSLLNTPFTGCLCVFTVMIFVSCRVLSGFVQFLYVTLHQLLVVLGILHAATRMSCSVPSLTVQRSIKG